MLGLSAISLAYNGEDGALFVNSSEGSQPNTTSVPGGAYGADDTVGIGLDLDTGKGFVTRNGERMDLGK